MLKKFRNKHPLLYCITAEVVFFAAMFLAILVITLGLLYGGVDIARVDEYMLNTIQELVGVLVMLLFLWRTDKLELLRRRGSGFFNGLLVGMFPLVLILYNMISQLMMAQPERPLRSGAQIAWFLVSFVLVGVAEELAFRGVVAQTLLEHYGNSRAGVWKASLLSGLLFGAAHLTNLGASAAFGVLMQCAFAFALGTLFAAIYFRTGNLWVTIFLHGMMDISAMLMGGLYGTETVAESISSYDATMLLSVAIYLLATAFLLRKKKVGEAALYFSEATPAPAAAPAAENEPLEQ